MTMLSIFSRDCIRQAEAAAQTDLPSFYMNDYSKLGLQVSSLENAMEVLRRNQYNVSEGGSSATLTILKHDDIIGIVHLLTAQGIECEMTDMVNAIYQG